MLLIIIFFLFIQDQPGQPLNFSCQDLENEENQVIIAQTSLALWDEQWKGCSTIIAKTSFYNDFLIRSWNNSVMSQERKSYKWISYLKEYFDLLNNPKDCDSIELECSKKYRDIYESFLPDNLLVQTLGKIVLAIKSSQKRKAIEIMKDFMQTDPFMMTLEISKSDFSDPQNIIDYNQRIKDILLILKKYFIYEEIFTYFCISIDPENQFKVYNPVNWSQIEIKKRFSRYYNGLKFPRLWFNYFHAKNNNLLLKEYLRVLNTKWKYLSDLQKEKWVFNKIEYNYIYLIENHKAQGFALNELLVQNQIHNFRAWDKIDFIP